MNIEENCISNPLKKEKTRTSFNLYIDRVRWLKDQAFAEERYQSDIIEEALRDYEVKSQVKLLRRVVPRVEI